MHPHLTALAASAALAIAAALPSGAKADEAPPAVPFTYEMFEQSVPHLDLAVCPAPLAGPLRAHEASWGSKRASNR